MTDNRSHLKVRKASGVSVVEFADRKILEEISIAEIGDELSLLVSSSPGVQLLVSFKDVEHLSSAALGMLINLNKSVAEKSGHLKLADITPQIFEVFKITRLNKLFHIYDSADQAMGAFPKAG